MHSHSELVGTQMALVAVTMTIYKSITNLGQNKHTVEENVGCVTERGIKCIQHEVKSYDC